MAKFLLCFLLFTLLPMSQFSQATMQLFCQTNTKKYVGPKLPKLPTAFVAQVEANIVNRNYSLLMTEYYDESANKGAARIVKNGKSHYMLYNYNEDEMMVIDEASKNCTLQEIRTMHGHPFFGRNGSKIEGIADLFRFGYEYHETFIGNATVRGIPCYHWQACINHNHSSFLIDYYFSIPGWNMPFGEMQVVRATINGTSDMSHHRSNPTLPSNSTRPFYHVYDFFSFKAGSPPVSSLQLPQGVFCSGMKDRKMLPSFPSVFSLELESVYPSQKSVWYMKEYYDINRKLVMFRFYDYQGSKGPHGETRIIHDFNHGVLYNISGFVCQNVTRLTPMNTAWDGTETKDHHLRMKMFTENIYSRNKSALMYHGVANVRGIDADVWIIKQASPYYHHELTMEYYFAKPSWKVAAGSLPSQSQVLLRIDVHSTNSPHTMNVISFDGESVPLYTFSIAPCFVDKKYMLSLRLLGDWKSMVYKQEMQFNIAVRKSIAEAANVTSLRIDDLMSGEGKEVIWIWFTLLGKPAILGPDAPLESELKDAVESLKKKVMDGRLVVKWTNPASKASMEVKADKYFENLLAKPTKPPGGKDNKKRRTKGVPGGAVAGVAFLMTAIGICIGLLIAHIIMKRRGASLFRYQRHQ